MATIIATVVLIIMSLLLVGMSNQIGIMDERMNSLLNILLKEREADLRRGGK